MKVNGTSAMCQEHTLTRMAHMSSTTRGLYYSQFLRDHSSLAIQKIHEDLFQLLNAHYISLERKRSKRGISDNTTRKEHQVKLQKKIDPSNDQFHRERNSEENIS